MFDRYVVKEGDFGRIEVIRHQHDLVMRAHPYTHFAFWVSGGSATSNVGNHAVTICPDVALVVNSNASHDLQMTDSKNAVVFLNLYVNDGWLDAQFKGLAHSMVFPNACIHTTSSIREALAQLLKKLIQPRSKQLFNLEVDVALLIRQSIASATTHEQLQAMPKRRRMIDYRLRVAIEHMKNNLNGSKTAVEVADVVGLSRSRFFELFHDQLGTSPLVFWNAMRLEEALTCLNTHEGNMTSMSKRLGFSTPGNFSRFFKDQRGVTPSTYRRVCHDT